MAPRSYISGRENGIEIRNASFLSMVPYFWWRKIGSGSSVDLARQFTHDLISEGVSVGVWRGCLGSSESFWCIGRFFWECPKSATLQVSHFRAQKIAPTSGIRLTSSKSGLIQWGEKSVKAEIWPRSLHNLGPPVVPFCQLFLGRVLPK